ncbi:MAG: L,D-transpeptidase [Alphaproteobacteria bacterium]|nr:L,D-transpeptidase [Alphaproteobacteria bacterium]
MPAPLASAVVDAALHGVFWHWGFGHPASHGGS